LKLFEAEGGSFKKKIPEVFDIISGKKSFSDKVGGQ
jgi:hypothetical protein